MTQITGTQGTVTFEVVTENEEIRQLLGHVLKNQVTSLVNEQTTRLRQMLSIPPAPTKQASSGVPPTPAEKYAKENIEEPELIALGGKWAYAISVVTSEGGEKSVRIAKGQIKGSYYRDKLTDKMVLKPNDKMAPISLVNKINIKRMSEWDQLQGPVVSRLQAIEAPRK